jgi:hypothetical protein
MSLPKWRNRWHGEMLEAGDCMMWRERRWRRETEEEEGLGIIDND